MKKRINVVLVMIMSLALLFGYATSGICGGAPDPSTVRTDIAYWEDCSWVDMTEAEQALWAKLGWNEDSWEGEAKQPASEDKYWNQLSSEEQDAARALGYTKATWDEE